MVVYWLSFLISLALIGFTEKKHKVTFMFASVVAILIPCLVAALRAETVGTDVGIYVKPMFDAANKADNFSQYWNSFWFSKWRFRFVYEHEIGFSAMLYGVTKATGSLGWVLFLIQALTIVPIYSALAMDRKNIPVWPGMMVYYFAYYNSTLNMMRQWIAMGFLLLAFQMLRRKKYFPCLLIMVVAFLFHYSTLIILPIFAVYFFLRLFRKKTLVEGNLRISGKTFMVLLVFAAGIVLLMNLNMILSLIVKLGMTRFTPYLSGNALTMQIGQIIIRLPLLCMVLVSWPQFRKATPEAPFFLAILLVELLAAQMISIAEAALRISYYFAFFSIIIVPYLFKYQKTTFHKRGVSVVLIGFYVFYWFYLYVYHGSCETLPYRFSFMVR